MNFVIKKATEFVDSIALVPLTELFSNVFDRSRAE